mgnify:CR=1 FL=1
MKNVYNNDRGVFERKIIKRGKMNMNKIGKRILAAAVASSVLVTPVFADPSVDDLKKSKESAQNEVSSLQTQLNTVVGKITELESQLSSKGEEIIQAQSDLEDAEAEEQKQYADMKVRIKYMYEAGDQSAVESLVGSEDFSDMVNKAEYVSNVHNYDRQKLQEYVETKQKISDLKDQLEEEQSQLESMQTEYESQESKLDNLIASKQAEVSDLDQQIEEAERKAAEEELKRQQEEAARQAAAAEAARQQAASNRNNSSSSSSNSSSNSNKGNSSNKGTSNNAPSYVSGDAVSRAYSALGKPYVWGATGPNSFDCSGLVGFCLTGRYSRSCTSASLNALPTVSNPQPGDVCVRSGHCGIYIGNGQMIHAPHTGDVVKVASVPSNMRIVRP